MQASLFNHFVLTPSIGLSLHIVCKYFKSLIFQSDVHEKSVRGMSEHENKAFDSQT